MPTLDEMRSELRTLRKAMGSAPSKMSKAQIESQITILKSVQGQIEIPVEKVKKEKKPAEAKVSEIKKEKKSFEIKSPEMKTKKTKDVSFKTKPKKKTKIATYLAISLTPSVKSLKSKHTSLSVV
jgi:hypothetical protein